MAFAEKPRVLYDAPYVLNKPDQPWYITVEGDAIVARWKWMDAYFFAPHEVTEETKMYTFTVVLSDNGKYKEIDQTEDKARGFSFGGDGTVGVGMSKDMFAGKKTQKSIQFGIGKDKQTGQIGIIGFKFDTNAVKQPIRDFLANYGWKKAGLFG